jgi:hypothetical protein
VRHEAAPRGGSDDAVPNGSAREDQAQDGGRFPTAYAAEEDVAGNGTGQPCAGCDLPILPDQVEYEFGNGHMVRMHLGCAALWEAEHRRASAG